MEKKHKQTNLLLFEYFSRDPGLDIGTYQKQFNKNS